MLLARPAEGLELLLPDRGQLVGALRLLQRRHGGAVMNAAAHEFLLKIGPEQFLQMMSQGKPAARRFHDISIGYNDVNTLTQLPRELAGCRGELDRHEAETREARPVQCHRERRAVD